MKLYSFSWFLVFIILVSFVGSLAFSAQSGEEKWTFAGFTKYRDAIFINKNNISYQSHDTARVWAKIAPSEKSKYYREIKRELKKSKKSSKGFKYTELLTDIDCAGNRIRYLQIIYFNTEGTVIYATSHTETAWKKIHPGSLWENIQKTVCNK